LSGAPSGEQPPAARIGRSGQVRPGRQVLTDDRVERRRDGCWRVAQPSQHLAIVNGGVVNGGVVDGQSCDLGWWLGVEQYQERDDAFGEHGYVGSAPVAAAVRSVWARRWRWSGGVSAWTCLHLDRPVQERTQRLCDGVACANQRSRSAWVRSARVIPCWVRDEERRGHAESFPSTTTQHSRGLPNPGRSQAPTKAAWGIEPQTYALRACRVRDGGRWSERSSAGSLRRSRRLVRASDGRCWEYGARRGHGIAAAAFDADQSWTTAGPALPP
jgi:hypothetical protein